MIFLIHPLKKDFSKVKRRWLKIIVRIVDGSLIIGNLFVIGYVILFEEQLARRLGSPTAFDAIICIIGFLCVLEACRRVAPPALVIVMLAACAYAIFGNYIPGAFGHRGYLIGDLIQYLYFSNEGIFGIGLKVMVNIIFVFLVLSTFLTATGIGRTIINAGLSLVGHLKGGPALSAVVASGLFGSICGTGSANVLATGTFTIPLMLKTGYKKNFAGAVEAVASSGGMFTPPIMASAAFVMAEILGIPYLRICIAAIVPALLYYTAVFIMVYLRACKENLEPLPKDERPHLGKTLKEGGIFFLPVILLIGLLIKGYTPPFAAFYSIVFLFFLSLLRKSTRGSLGDYIRILDKSARRSISLFACLAGIGIIIGVVSLTGLGIKFSLVITTFAGSNLLLCFIMVMMATLTLSMGMPTLPSYLLVIIVVGTALERMGAPVLAVHLFVLYFASMSSITPPVCMSAYAAAGISGGDPMKIGFNAVRLGLAGFIVPYVYVFSPALIFMGSAREIVLTIIRTFGGIVSVAIALEGYFLRKMKLFFRALLGVGGLALIIPNSMVNFTGLGLLVFGFVLYLLSGRRKISI